MKYLLDTDTCIYIIKKKPAQVLRHFKPLVPGDVAVSAITVAELRYGVEKSADPERNHNALEEFLIPLDIAPFDEPATLRYGRIRATLERGGKPIGSMDFLIAAHALSLSACLVTNNTREFARVPGLVIENWAGGGTPHSSKPPPKRNAGRGKT